MIWKTLFAAVIAVGMALGFTSSASALPAGQAAGFADVAGRDDLKVDVHGWHCRSLYSPYQGWHRHPGACAPRYYAPRYYAPRYYAPRFYAPRPYYRPHYRFYH